MQGGREEAFGGVAAPHMLKELSLLVSHKAEHQRHNLEQDRQIRRQQKETGVIHGEAPRTLNPLLDTVVLD